jgi:hypothetical protein
VELKAHPVVPPVRPQRAELLRARDVAFLRLKKVLST